MISAILAIDLEYLSFDMLLFTLFFIVLLMLFINRLYTPNAVKIQKLKVKREFVSPKNLRDFKFQAAINSPKVMRLDTKKKLDKKATLSTLKNNFEISQS